MVNTLPMTPVIASRAMTWTRADGVQFPALIEIGTPFPNPMPLPNEGEWCCQVRSEGLGDDEQLTLFGGDSVEALTYALIFGGTFASCSLVAQSLDWANVPNYGFPILPPGYGNPAPAAS